MYASKDPCTSLRITIFGDLNNLCIQAGTCDIFDASQYATDFFRTSPLQRKQDGKRSQAKTCFLRLSVLKPASETKTKLYANSNISSTMPEVLVILHEWTM
jgi:hypothetical protein